MRIAQVSDLHLDDFLAQKYRLETRAHLGGIFADLAAARPDLLVLSGDLGAPSSHPWLLDQVRALGVPALTILGNHDRLAEVVHSGLAWEPSVSATEYYYARRLGEAWGLFLDSGSGTVSAPQQEWLAGQLERATGPILVFCHHPLVPVDPVFDRFLGLSNRGEVLSVLEHSGKAISVFCGHYHGASHRASGLVHQYVAPAVIMQIRSEGGTLASDSFDAGYQLLTVEDDRVTVQRRLFLSDRLVQDGE
jgi:3',5'-cyclic AMP phosphodiesterase CpdA